MKADIIKRVLGILIDEGYAISDCRGTRSCFDVIAKKENVFLIKILTNVEALNSKSAGELKQVASIISAIPLIIGDHKKNAKLSNGVLYARYDVGVVNIKTFDEIIKERFPMIYSVRGDYCMRIKSRLLSKIRHDMGLTQDELASRLNVSKQSIHRYESTGRVSLKIAENLFELVKDDITMSERLHPSKSPLVSECFTGHKTYCKLSLMKREVRDKLVKIGFVIYPTNAPFDLVVERGRCEKRILSVVGNDLKTVTRKVEINEDITRITGDYSICISEKEQDLDVPMIKPRELKSIESADEFIEILFE
ncbi:MAG: helix-turn-helix domain-containing protein [Candidatus Altiarchaeota archaeon]|nr:helix-turn-helix domain-containing protein [Candidatus Altiarchaeota archaeon]